MSVSARLELDHLLGGSVQSLGLLSDQECADLLDAIRVMRGLERDELSADIEASLAGFPRILRPVIKGVFYNQGLP